MAEEIEESLDIRLALHDFRKEEFDQTIAKAKSISALLEEIDQEKEKICALESGYDSRIFHFAHEQLTVIQSNLQQQLAQLQRLRGDLEQCNVVRLESDRSFAEFSLEKERFTKVIQFFIPYILVCTIYLRYHQEGRISRQAKSTLESSRTTSHTDRFEEIVPSPSPT